MSESSVKSSVKKGFKAPVLQVLGDTVNSVKRDALEVEVSKTQKLNTGDESKTKQLEGVKADKKEKKPKKKQEKKEESSENKLCPKKVEKLNQKHGENKELAHSDGFLLKEKKFKKKLKDNKELEGSETCPRQGKKFKKPEVSLTDCQYEEIFKAVLQGSSGQHNTPIEEILEVMASSSEISSVKGGQKNNDSHAESEESVKTLLSLKEQNVTLPELSPWGSHLSKQNSQASSILKELQESQASSLLSPVPSSSSEDTDGDDDVVSQRSVRQLSQRSYTDTQPTPAPRKHKVNKRPMLEELQAKRNVGLWVFCDRMTCQMQRYLPDVTDPLDLPNVWYCHMNPDPRYNSCSCEEQEISPEDEEDMIDNQFTCGSVVWARVTGFPWWPAMVDDDPDLECYYWLLEDMRTVTFYHVVFFDKNEVTRAWIPIKYIVPFKKNLNTFKQRTARGIDFTSRLLVAKDQAEDASLMAVAERLKKYSFIARYKGPIFDDQAQAEKTKKKYKLKCSIGEKETVKRGRKRCANTNIADLTRFKPVVETITDRKDQKQRKLSEKEVEKKTTGKVENDSNTNISLSEALEDQLNKGFETASIASPSPSTNISEHKLSPKVGKENKSLNPETTTAEPQKLKDSNESETPSLLFDAEENVKSAAETITDSLEEMETDTSSVVESNVSQKSKTSSLKAMKTTEGVVEDSFGSVVEPSQACDRSQAGDENSQQNKLSQSTIAEFLGAESEDAVVPEADFSQHSEPFEE